MLATHKLEEILEARSTLAEAFTAQVDNQLQAWGVETVKNIEFMDIRDSANSQVIANIMAKEKSRIDRESREAVAMNSQMARTKEIEAERIAIDSYRHAIESVGADDPSYVLYGETITAVDGVVRNAAGALAGSALDMATAVRNSVRLIGLPLEEAARMASTYPAEFLGLGETHGRIAPGYRADLVALDAEARPVVGSAWQLSVQRLARSLASSTSSIVRPSRSDRETSRKSASDWLISWMLTPSLPR